MYTQRLALLVIVSLMTGGCGSIPRDAAGTLAANTSRVNAELEKMTASRQQIEAARTRLVDSLERATLEAQGATARRLEVWRALADADSASKLRAQLFEAGRLHVQAAFARQAEIDHLDTKLAAASAAARGSQSKELAQSVTYLAALSKDRSLKDDLAFLFEYAKNVQNSIEAASLDAAKAAERTKAAETARP